MSVGREKGVRSALTRRDVLRGGGLLVVGLALDAVPASAQSPSAPAAPDIGSLDRWLAISRDGSVTVFTGYCDIGTGVETAFAQIVAEELAVPFNAVHLVMGDTGRTIDQGRTIAAQGIVTAVRPLQAAAARARVALIELAAQRWKVEPASLVTANGAVFIAADSRKRISYGRLIGNRRFDITLKVSGTGRAGEQRPVLESAVPPKPPAQYDIVGRPIPRVDIPAKVFGTFEYVHNVRLPGMLHARVLRPPHDNARLLDVDRTTLPAGFGVRIVQERDFLAVVGEREAHVVQAASVLQARWEGAVALPEEADLSEALRTAPAIADRVTVTHGDVEAGLAAGALRIEESFTFPFFLHGMIGPSCAVADVRDGAATIWSGTQSPVSDRDDIADMLGLPHDKVRLIWRESSGSYGRLSTDDAAADAALLSMLVGRPVRVQWMRHDEHGNEPRCPAESMRITAAIDGTGKITAVDYVKWSASHMTGTKGNQLAWRALGTAPGNPATGGIGAGNIAFYDFPALRIRNVTLQPWLRHVYMRSPGSFQSMLAFESLFDEAAYLTGSDPVAYRLRHLTDERDRAAVTRVAELSGWEPRRAFPGSSDTVARGQGVAFTRFGARDTRIAMVLNVDVNRTSGEVKLRRLTVVVDCGLVVNPDGARNQIEGGALQGLGRALKEEVRFNQRAITCLNWLDYSVLKFVDVPQVTVEFINRPELPPSAVGEEGTTPTAGLLANAIFDATGKRLRRAPFTPERVLAALHAAAPGRAAPLAG